MEAGPNYKKYAISCHSNLMQLVFLSLLYQIGLIANPLSRRFTERRAMKWSAFSAQSRLIPTASLSAGYLTRLWKQWSSPATASAVLVPTVMSVIGSRMSKTTARFCAGPRMQSANKRIRASSSYNRPVIPIPFGLLHSTT